MAYAIIEGGTVANIAVATPEFAAEQGWVLAPAHVGIGWAYDGTEWTPPAPEPEPQPEDITVSRMQARMALYQAGLLSEVQAIVAQGDPLMQMAWAEAVEWKRSSPMINGLAQQLGLSAAQVDALFLNASQIEV